MSHGPVMLDLAGTVLTPEERKRLEHPACGGVILFTRNYESPEQLSRLVSSVHEVRHPRLLVAVDHEGGRVQRFRDGFTEIPPAGWIGEVYDDNPQKAVAAAREMGWLMAAELRVQGVDISFAPVLDLGRGICDVIGNRAFHSDPEVVAELAHAWMAGMHEAGMPAVGKHFPGHGGVVEDSHLALPSDARPVRELLMEDLVPFQRLVNYGIEAMMPAHVVFSEADSRPAGFSAYWLKTVLRNQLGFQGVIFSDDLSMAAAEEAGGYAQRAQAALAAGCDMVIICNNPDGADEALDALQDYENPAAQSRLLRMHGRGDLTLAQLHEDPRWHEAAKLAAIPREANLALNL